MTALPWSIFYCIGYHSSPLCGLFRRHLTTVLGETYTAETRIRLDISAGVYSGLFQPSVAAGKFGRAFGRFNLSVRRLKIIKIELENDFNREDD